MDEGSLGDLARAGRASRMALSSLLLFHLVQEPFEGRYALHAVVRHRVRQKTHFDEQRLVSHFVTLLEREHGRFDLEQTHLFFAMDWVQRAGDLSALLRIEKLLEDLPT